jgi:Tol biopolymer transport system component
MLDLIRNTSSRLTFDGTSVIPIWSPDGSRILYRSQQAGPGDLYQRLSSGAGAEEALLKSNAMKNPTDWSSDGRFIVYENQGDSKTGLDIWVLPTTGDRKPFPFLQTQFSEQQGRLSPDGRWIAYTSEETGNLEVYVQSFPVPGGKWQISTSGGADPRWRRDGKELYFISSDRKLMGVEVKAADSTFQAGLPLELFEARVSGLTDVRAHYTATADGKRFLVSSLSEDDGSSPMTVVLNWTAALKK